MIGMTNKHITTLFSTILAISITLTCKGGTHWNIEHKYATAYIKRMQQFLRHCAKTNGDVTKKTRHPKVPKERNRDASRESRSSNSSTHGPDAASPSALDVNFNSIEMNTYSTKDHEAIHQHHQHPMNPSPGTDNHRRPPWP